MIDFQERKRVKRAAADFSGRRRFLLAVMMVGVVVLIGRAIDLQVFRKEFLKDQGDMRQVDEVAVSAYRGVITDRNGAPLAISTPVASISVNPKEFKGEDKNRIKQLEKAKYTLLKAALTPEQKEEVHKDYEKERADKIAKMEKLLNLPKGKIAEVFKEESHRQFIYLARRINPVVADQVQELKLPGISFEREFKRYYPTGEVSAHLIGFTDIDDEGQEGLESSYEKVLKGTPGSKRVIRDGQRRIIEDVENIKDPVPGRNLKLSIDQRIQYLAYRELQQAVTDNKARSGALVVMDAKNGEVLAAVNQPSFNPNSRENLKENLYRNRAMTDIFEPGSTIKPFVVAAALEGGYIRPGDKFETNGMYKVGRHVVRDVHNYGTLDVTGVIKKSSNIGVSQMALKMPPKYFWDVYHNLGFGVSAGSGFPNEASGRLLDHRRWRDFDRATLSFGYGLNVSALQLARSYTALADDGLLHSVSLLQRDEDEDVVRIFSKNTAKRVRTMMESVITKDGTAYEARVDGYTVAGKTGTVKKASGHGYSEKTYFAVFAGFAPATDPKLIIVVMIDEPSAGQYYGGLVSAPVFAKVMAGALRVLEIAPDKEETMPLLLTSKEH